MTWHRPTESVGISTRVQGQPVVPRVGYVRAVLRLCETTWTGDGFAVCVAGAFISAICARIGAAALHDGYTVVSIVLFAIGSATVMPIPVVFTGGAYKALKRLHAVANQPLLLDKPDGKDRYE